MSVLLHPLTVGSAPLLWRDGSHRPHRRAYIHLLRYQRLEMVGESAPSPTLSLPAVPLSRAQRAHARLSSPEHLARNARGPTTAQVTITLFRHPILVADWLNLAHPERLISASPRKVGTVRSL